MWSESDYVELAQRGFGSGEYSVEETDYDGIVIYKLAWDGTPERKVGYVRVDLDDVAHLLDEYGGELLTASESEW